MDTVYEQGEFVGNAILHWQPVKITSRESRDDVDGAERRVVPLRSERAGRDR